ncbi:mechanosensitive ion channel family protein [Bremerella alba]|uniref:mechanosensitive ion channel family protein n=1 Tax=Bremerella alba TaxID=980252 RepID=UPI001A955CE9|nr:mechanosensitive ion channel domain-containing protein [Bremerella alba]
MVDSLNDGIPTSDSSPDLSTPLATVENFIFACREKDFARAAQSLNFKLIPQDQRDQAAYLAENFYYVLNQRLWVDIEDLPDRADGQVINRIGKQDPMAGKPRKSIRLGVINIDDWKEVRVRLQRVKVGDGVPIWLFSAQTVEKIPALYQEYGPSWVEEAMPAWAKTRLAGKVPIWEWFALFVFVAAGVCVGYVTQGVAGYAILHRQRKERLWIERLIDDLRVPVAVASAALTTYLLKQAFLSLTGPVNTVVDPVMLLVVVGAIAWAVLRGLDVATSFTMDRYVNTLKDDIEGAEQGLLTKISIARRLVALVAVFVVVGVVLIQLNIFDAVGYGLLASAGVTTVILGIAAQPILGNLLAGLQIAITQPVRIGDSVLFEGHWGHVEGIKFTYLTIRTWDKRRLIVPLQYLISKPVENWTKVNEDLTRPIKVYVDYTTDVQIIREKFQEMATQHELWDQDSEPIVQVTDCSDESMEVRALCHAKSPADAWNLHCEMREKLIAFVQDLESGKYLPRERIRMLSETAQGNGKQASHSDR